MRIEHLHFSDSAFKGVNEKYSLKNYALYIMQRVLTFGSSEDIKLLRNHYGDTTFKNEIIQAPYLNAMTFNWACITFKIKRESFLFFKNMNERQRETYLKRPMFLWPGKDIDEIYCDDFETYMNTPVFPNII